MTIEDILNEAVHKFTLAGLSDARSEAEFLVAALLKKSRARLMLDRRNPVKGAGLKKMRTGIRMRARRWPLAYITQDQPFRDLVLKVTPDVLIPRPETEELVQRVLERMAIEKRPVIVADIGAGSGCIAICVARSPWAKGVYAIDRSAKALKVAQANARLHGVAKRCRWLKGNLAAPFVKAGIRVDYVVANLPYVSSKEMKALEPELFREPARALHGGPDGLDFIYTLIAQAPHVLNPRGWLMLEIGFRQDHAVRKLLQASGLWDHIEIHHDLSGIARFVEAQFRRLGD